MTEETEIINGNVLIADFIEYNWEKGIQLKGTIFKLYAKDLNYHLSWNQLMEVVEKIESIRDKEYGWFVVTTRGNSCDIDSAHLHLHIMGEDVKVFSWNNTASTKIESVWGCVVHFITFYNAMIKVK